MPRKIKTTVVGSYPVPSWLVGNTSRLVLRDAARIHVMLANSRHPNLPRSVSIILLRPAPERRSAGFKRSHPAEIQRILVDLNQSEMREALIKAGQYARIQDRQAHRA
jgi:hypothetical protein